MLKQSNTLRKLLENEKFLMLPGIYDCLSACIAEDVGFKAVYFSGGAFSMAQFGRPDMGFWGLSDLTAAMTRIMSTVEVPVIVDSDNAFGNAIHAANAAEMLCRMGVSGMQLDDDILPQKYPGRSKEAMAWEMLAPKIQAIRSAVDDDFILILRCMLGNSEGIEKAIERANMAHEIGVDYVYFDGIKSDDDLELISKTCRSGKMINLNEMTYSAKLPIDKIKNYGFSIGLYPVSSVQAAAEAYRNIFSVLAKTGSTVSEMNNMTSSTDILNLMGMQKLIDTYLPFYKIKKETK